MEDREVEDKKRVEAIRDRNDYSYVYGDLNTFAKNYSRKNGLDDNEAYDDIFQNSVIALFEIINKDGFELTSRLSGFFIGIFRNQMYKHFNSVSTRIPDDYDICCDNEYEYDGNVITNIILNSLERLSSNHKSIIHLMYFEGRSHGEIAEELGFSNADSIKTQKYKALKKIRPIIEDKLVSHGINDYKLEF